MRNLFLLFIFFQVSIVLSQKVDTSKYGYTYRYEMDNSSFPHQNRSGGYVYKGQHYNAEDHYNDSSVLVFIPNHFTLSDSINLVFYFHGWYNNIDTTLVKFNLQEQFYRSKKNAILILAEGAKNSPDGYGGHLEEKDVFKDLVDEIFDELQDVFNIKPKIDQIVLSGHSGAYRVMSYILLHGGLTEKIKGIHLFDALYNDAEKYTYWIDNYNGRFINIYTPNGGTKGESENLMFCFDGWKIPYKFIEDDDFSTDDLLESRIIIIKSELGHSDVIHTKNQFQKFLKSSF